MASGVSSNPQAFWMGVPPEREFRRTNYWQFKARIGQREILAEEQATGDSFNDGNEHTLAIEARAGLVTCSIDDIIQTKQNIHILKIFSLCTIFKG